MLAWIARGARIAIVASWIVLRPDRVPLELVERQTASL
jgi:hypothetical protein